MSGRTSRRIDVYILYRPGSSQIARCLRAELLGGIHIQGHVQRVAGTEPKESDPVEDHWPFVKTKAAILI
jgi:hypothetical protein